ncbi:hypothetical protein Tco_0574852, partial [Tanacetum coccineum]
QENGVVLDEEELLFLASEQGNTFDADVDNQPVQDLALNEEGDIEQQLWGTIKGTTQIIRTKNEGNLWKLP